RRSAGTSYEALKKQYNLLYGIDYLEKQNETLQRIEKSLLELANQRREIQKSLNEVQAKIRDTRNLIDKTPRNSDNYMDLFTKEHQLIKTEYSLADSLKFEEEKEREMLSLFSENIRKSHQIDLVRQSRQKLLSFVYSIFGGIFGFGLNAYFNRYKNAFFTHEIDRIKDQHEVTLAELETVSGKLDDILELQVSAQAALAKLQQTPKQQKQQQQQQQQSSSSSYYLSYLAWPFVKAYRLFV
ncbi:Coiled-coil domain-containing protein 51, partial [Tyrophagus putrescentiae]